MRTMTKAGRCFSREMQPFWRDAMGRWARGPRGRKQDKTPGLLNKNTIIPPKHPVPTRLAFLPGSRENRTGQCSFGKACQQAAARGSDRVLHLGGPRDIRVPNGCGVRCHSVCVSSWLHVHCHTFLYTIRPRVRCIERSV